MTHEQLEALIIKALDENRQRPLRLRLDMKTYLQLSTTAKEYLAGLRKGNDIDLEYSDELESGVVFITH